MEYTGIPGSRADSSDRFFATRYGGSCQRLTLIKQYLSNHIISHTIFRAFIQAIVFLAKEKRAPVES